MFGTIKTELISFFDEWYTVVTGTTVVTTTIFVAAETSFGEKEMPYREFNNTKPPEFNSVRDTIVSMRWISDVEGCFYTSACSANLKFRYMQNLLSLGAKDWCNFFTKNYSAVEKSAVTWEQFVEKFMADYVPPTKRERLTQEYLSLKQTIE